MDFAAVLAPLLHLLSRTLVLVPAVRGARTLSSISLVMLQAYAVVYVLRGAELPVVFTSATSWLDKLSRILVALLLVVLRSNARSTVCTDDAEVDTVPLWALVLPPFLCSLVFNRVFMIVEICHQCSWFLEPLVLIPQFLVMVRRRSYGIWVLVFVALAGLEGVVENMHLWGQTGTDRDVYRYTAAIVQAGLLACGLLLLVFQRLAAQPGALNESGEKPKFDEVWEAQKFTFSTEVQPAGAHVGSGSRLV